jgi:hypothetical protein
MAAAIDEAITVANDYAKGLKDAASITAVFEKEQKRAVAVVQNMGDELDALAGVVDDFTAALEANGGSLELTEEQLYALEAAGFDTASMMDEATGAAYLNAEAFEILAAAALGASEDEFILAVQDIASKMLGDIPPIEDKAQAYLYLAQCAAIANAVEGQGLETVPTKPGPVATPTGRGGGGGGSKRKKEAQETISKIIEQELELLKRKRDLREIDEYEYKTSLEAMLSSQKLNNKEREKLDSELHRANVDFMKATESRHKEVIKEGHEAEKDRVERFKELLKDQETSSVEFFAEGSSERLELVSREYLERIRWIEEESAVYDDAVNEQMRLEVDRNREVMLNKEAEVQAELELLSITNQGLYEQIVILRERNEQIKAGQEMRREQAQAERDAAKDAELVAKIATEDDYDKLKSLQEQLKAHRDTVAENKLIKIENAEIATNNKTISDLTKEIKDNTVEAKNKTAEYNKEVKETVDLMTAALEKGQAGDVTFSINLESIKTSMDTAIKQLENMGGEMLIQMGIDNQSIERMLGETADVIKEQQKPITDEITSLSGVTYNLLNDMLKQMQDKLIADIKTMFAYMVEEMQRGIARLRELQREAESIMSSVTMMAGTATTVVQHFYDVREEETAYAAAREVQRVAALGGDFN